MRLHIWNARDPRDTAQWIAIHRAWSRREAFAHPAYLRLFAGEREEPLAAYAATDSGFILYPFVLRPIDAPHLRSVAPDTVDLTSPYSSSSGGAFREGTTEVEAKEFWSIFDDFCQAQGVVSEFTRLHVFAEQRLPHPGPTELRLMNVVRDLRTPLDQIWREFEHKVRKNVNKARRNGVTVEVDESGERLDEFLAIYWDTMLRREARPGYHFPRDFFTALIKELRDQFVFLHAVHEERVIASELVLVSAHNLYSYLGGTDEAAFDLRPNDLLKFELIRWGQQRGKNRLLLGGGYAPDDGIFRYKRSFAPQGLLPYSTGSRIHDESAYTRLTEAHYAEARRRDSAWRPDPGFFPAYRQELPPSPSAGPASKAAATSEVVAPRRPNSTPDYAQETHINQHSPQ